VNPYTGVTTNKIGSSSGNDATISRSMRYSQYVNNNKGFKNVQRMSYTEYVAKYGPLPEFNSAGRSNPMFKTNYN
jgi:hypothetical protein